MDRLGQPAIRAHLGRALHGFRIVRRRHHADAKVFAVVLAQEVAGLEPVHVRHAHVEEHQIVAVARRMAEEVLGIRDASHRAPRGLQDATDEREDVLVVVDDEHPLARRLDPERTTEQGEQVALQRRQIERPAQRGVAAPVGGICDERDARVRKARLDPLRALRSTCGIVQDDEVGRERGKSVKPRAVAERGGGDSLAGKEIAQERLFRGVLVEQHDIGRTRHGTSGSARIGSAAEPDA